MDKETLLQMLADWKCIVAPEFEDALLGISHCSTPKAVYDIDTIIAILIERDGMTQEDEIDHFDYNIAGSYVGKSTPVFVWYKDLDLDSIVNNNKKQ